MGYNVQVYLQGLWEQDVGGSNPLAPTNKINELDLGSFFEEGFLATIWLLFRFRLNNLGIVRASFFLISSTRWAYTRTTISGPLCNPCVCGQLDEIRAGREGVRVVEVRDVQRSGKSPGKSNSS